MTKKPKFVSSVFPYQNYLYLLLKQEIYFDSSCCSEDLFSSS